MGLAFQMSQNHVSHAGSSVGFMLEESTAKSKIVAGEEFEGALESCPLSSSPICNQDWEFGEGMDSARGVIAIPLYQKLLRN